MPKLLGIVGLLVICAGLDLLWQSRHEIKFWIAAYLKVFRALLRHQQEPFRSLPIAATAEKRHGALRVLLGMGFAFFLGPILIVLGVTLMFYPHL
ncbi:MAG TPA: hypothetical protein VEU52_06115 [Candidatus Limnocylindrales bacterium]|nr:hypothetical protein [Candidatus Limnocylindrales bacterium]